MGVGRPSNALIRSREAKFMSLFYDETSEFYGKQVEAGRAAGYLGKNVIVATDRIVTKYCGKSFKESVEMLGMTRPYLASRVRCIIESEKTKGEVKLQAIKLLLSNFGEKTGEGSTTVNVNTPKALVMIGGSQKKLEAMVNPPLLEEHGTESRQPA